MAEDLRLFGWNLSDPLFESYFTEVIPPNNIWWLSRSPACLYFPSKFEWSPSLILCQQCAILLQYWYTVLGVDWPFASLLRRGLLCHREAGEKEKESAQGTMGKGKKEERRLFPLPIVLRALGIFRLLLFLLGYPAGASAEERDLLLPFNRRRGRNTSPSSFSWLIP